VLKEAETRRSAVHAETERLRERRRAALLHLTTPIRVAYEAALRAGHAPPITTARDGQCGVCRARLPATVLEAVGGGAVVVCRGCDRLLIPEPGQVKNMQEAVAPSPAVGTVRGDQNLPRHPKNDR
jgi:hypothetical protein